MPNLGGITLEKTPPGWWGNEDRFFTVFTNVPREHHVEIVAKSKSIEKALLYILKMVEGNWSRDTLVNCIKTDLYHTQGGAIANFSEQLPSVEELKKRIRLLEEELAQKKEKKNYKDGKLKTERVEMFEKVLAFCGEYKCVNQNNEPRLYCAGGL